MIVYYALLKEFIVITKINVTKSTLILVFTLFFLVSCSKSHEKYIGYWKLDSTNNLEAIEITKKNNTYILSDNIIKEKSQSFVLEKTGDQLSVNNGMTTINLKLANDSSLLIADKKYIKISTTEVDKIRANLNKKAHIWLTCDKNTIITLNSKSTEICIPKITLQRQMKD